jgi:serine phosphatase RsbU (regulator of sigma subunit)
LLEAFDTMGRLIRVLLIEDNPADARLIREMLVDAGDTRFDLDRTDRLETGLTLLRQSHFGVVLLDLTLPDSGGLDTFRTFRRRASQVPVVVLTGLDDQTVAQQAVVEGAQDYLVKGQVGGPQLIHALRFALGRHQRVRGVEAEVEEHREEMRLARQIQQRLFPAGAPALPSFDIHGASVPASAAGGDYYDYVPFRDGRLGLVIGDATHHGVGPALLMASSRAYLRALAQTLDDTGAILRATNRLLADDMGDGHNVTLLLAQLDPTTRTITHANAGHQPGYVLDRWGAPRVRLLATGVPLGLMPDEAYPAEPPVTLAAGELLLLLTDGIPDARNPAGEMYGLPRVLGAVAAHRRRPARDIVAAVLEDVQHFMAGEPQFDDMTLIVAKAE